MLEVWKEVKNNLRNQRYVYIITKIVLKAYYNRDTICNIVVISSYSLLGLLSVVVRS